MSLYLHVQHISASWPFSRRAAGRSPFLFSRLLSPANASYIVGGAAGGDVYTAERERALKAITSSSALWLTF